MKETIKVSIGGYAFTLDTDAYELLQGYLDNLKEYFSTKNEGAEVIQDIESRMSELLQLKNVKNEGVITLADAKDIIKIMGNPKDFGDESSLNEDAANDSNEKKPTSSITKKFYRDSDNAILGGVCSGIGHYFNLDPVIIRVAYVVLAFGVNPISGKLSAFMFLFYFLLWVIMPVARTFTEKLSMSGEDPTVESIQSGNVRSPKKGTKTGQVLLKTIRIIIGVFCYMIGISIILGGVAMLFLTNITGLPSMSECLGIIGMSKSSNLEISMIVAWFIPAIIFLYVGIRIMIKFTVRDLIIVGSLFAIWLVSSIYIGSAATRMAKEYRHNALSIETIQPQTLSNTLYVQLGKKYKNAESVSGENFAFKLEGDTPSWFLIPSIRVEKDSTANDFSIEINKRAFAWSSNSARQKAEDAHFDIVMTDSLVTINPALYNKNNIWDRQYYDITINCPTAKSVKTDAIFTRYKGYKKKNIQIDL